MLAFVPECPAFNAHSVSSINPFPHPQARASPFGLLLGRRLLPAACETSLETSKSTGRLQSPVLVAGK